MVVRGFTQSALRYPILLLVSVILFFELLLYVIIRLSVIVYEYLSGAWSGAKRHARLRMKRATDFVSWCHAARELDRLEGRDKWKRDSSSPYYDCSLIKEYIKTMKDCRDDGDMAGLAKILRQIYNTNNVAGIDNAQLYRETNFGTKHLIEEFIQSVLESTIVLKDAPDVPLSDKREFFRRIKKSYGNTVLCLSGGAAMAYFHIGVLKCLHEARLMPKIITGASGGSLIGSFVAVRTDKEIESDLFTPDVYRLFTPCEESWFTCIARYLRYGFMFDAQQWRVKMQVITKGDVTFLEAYKRTGRIFNVSITNSTPYCPSQILNYRNAPDVVIWSSVLASSAFPSVIKPVELLIKDSVTGELKPWHVHGKRWTDGTLANDIPIEQMTKVWNAHFFIVSQVNPHIIPLFYSSRGSTGRPSPHAVGSRMRGGFILSTLEKYLKLEMKKWLQLLAELDLTPKLFNVDWRYIFLQQWGGRISIVPEARIRHFFRIISDPSRDDMAEYILKGEKATWPKLNRIANHYRFERLIAECSASLHRQNTTAKKKIENKEKSTSKEEINHKEAIRSDIQNNADVAPIADEPSPSATPATNDSSPIYRGAYGIYGHRIYDDTDTDVTDADTDSEVN